jgi:hypothetical protein
VTDRKTPTKTGRPSPRSGVALPLGAHPKNTGGKKGRSGRKSKKFLALCLTASEDPYLWQASAKKHPLGLLDLSASYAHGKPTASVAIEGELVIRIVRESKAPR